MTRHLWRKEPTWCDGWAEISVKFDGKGYRAVCCWGLVVKIVPLGCRLPAADSIVVHSEDTVVCTRMTVICYKNYPPTPRVEV